MGKDGPQHCEAEMAGATPCAGSPPSGRYLASLCHLWSVMCEWLGRYFQLAAFLGKVVLSRESVEAVLWLFFTPASVSPFPSFPTLASLTVQEERQSRHLNHPFLMFPTWPTFQVTLVNSPEAGVERHTPKVLVEAFLP